MIHLRETIADLLSGDGDLADLVGDRIFHQEAPQGTRHPLVIFHQQAGTPRWTLGGPPVENKLWTVKAIGRTSVEVEPIATALEAALANLDGALEIRRESDINYSEPIEGATIRHLGGLYRIWVA